MRPRIFTLSADEMLRRWKLAGLYEPLDSGAEITVDDGLDLDSLLRLQIDSWYLRRLMEAPVESLPLINIASRLTPVSLPCGATRVSLPKGTIRVASVLMDGWSQPAAPITDPLSAAARAQSNPFSRGTSEMPVAVIHDNRTMTLYTPPHGIPPRLVYVLAVMQPPPGTYRLTADMLPEPLKP